jgi:2-dehydro-3-deoxyphosphogluconate aldolase/(4S)-4-hydroxy-2-oxoglutarate aldolase
MIALYNAGYRVLKFFPAELNGGAAFLKTVAAVMPQLTFCPTGGISTTNAADYLSLANVACIGGSWMASAKAISAQDWGGIRQLTGEAAAL